MKGVMRAKMKKLILGVAVIGIIIIGAIVMSRSFNNNEYKTNSKGSFVSSKGGSLPGIGLFDSDLLNKIEDMKKKRPKDYKPRTKHLNQNGSAKFTNRLFLESSPYLLQHAHNPVNWYPWGDEAFEMAKKLNRPVLLSVGYSTCHWCHVMEEESFENIEIAKVMNENYIAIKVDREERPDVDAIYMAAVRAMTRSGGWPMTVWLTPDRKPYYGGTYFVARDGDRGASVGFLTLLKRLKEVYDVQPDKVAESSEALAETIGKMLKPAEGGGLPSEQILHTAMDYYKGRFDQTYGGLSGAPKFPSSLPVRFLLRYHRRTGDQKALDAAVFSLKKMAEGGMYDQVGGGFHRYSTDERWHAPHFEKMLYDNALLVLAFLEAYQITKDPQFKRIAEEILKYVKREMISPEGAFYSATDADSLTPEGRREEGYFFTWTTKEIDQTLDSKNAELVKRYYNVSSQGSFEGRNILHILKPLKYVAKELNLSEGEARKKLNEARERLYQERLKRPPPIRDEKILSSWNGLMISAFAQAGLFLNEKSYIETAKKSGHFILEKLYKEGRLLRRYKDGHAGLNAYLDDYAALSAALLDLYEATGELSWLQTAIKLDKTLEEFYEDKENGGFFMTSHDHEDLLAREKPSYDGAEPSGNSIALLNLLRLHEFTLNDSYRLRIEKGFRAFSMILEKSPAALSEMLLAVDFYLDKPKEIVIVSPKGQLDQAEVLLSVFRNQYIPNRVLAVLEEGESVANQAKLIPLVSGKKSIQGKVTAYVCEKGICDLPTNEAQVFKKQISMQPERKDKN